MIYLGVDFGLKRIGLALSGGLLAAPLGVLTVANLTDSVSKLEEIISEKNVEIVIVGVPEGGIGRAAERFVAQLKKQGVEVVTVEETLSTKRARQTLLDLGVSRKKRRLDDAAAAAIILQDYLDEKK